MIKVNELFKPSLWQDLWKKEDSNQIEEYALREVKKFLKGSSKEFIVTNDYKLNVKEYASQEVKNFLEGFSEEFVQKYDYRSFENLDELIADRALTRKRKCAIPRNALCDMLLSDVSMANRFDTLYSSLRELILSEYRENSKKYLLMRGIIHNAELSCGLYHNQEVKFFDGESGAEIVLGKLVSQDPSKYVLGPHSYVLERYPQIIKRHTDWSKARNEQDLAYFLSSKHRSGNSTLDFVDVDDESKKYELKESVAEGKTLLDIMLADKDKKRMKSIKKHYFKLIDYAVDAAIVMNNLPMGNPMRYYHISEPYTALARKNNLPLEDAIDIGDTLKIMDSLNDGNPVNTNFNSSESNIEFEKFKNAYSKVQQFVNKYDSKHAMWLSDRNPKNIKVLEFEMGSLYKNYDTGSYIYGSLMTEISSILTQSSDYFTTKEQESFARHAAKIWNCNSGIKKIKMNNDMLKFLHCKNFYRRVRDMDQKMKNAFNLYSVKSSIQHFEYLDHLDGVYAQKNSALHELELLSKFDLVDDDSKKYISQSIEKRFDSFMQTLPSKEDIELDHKIYSLIKKEGLYHRLSQFHNYNLNSEKKEKYDRRKYFFAYEKLSYSIRGCQYSPYAASK